MINPVLILLMVAASLSSPPIATGAIRAEDAVFATAAIKNADIESLSASKLTAGTIDANVITVINLNASNINTGTMSGLRLSDGTVTDIKIASGLSATKITTGTLDAAYVNVTNLNASNITVGTMSGTRLADGSVASVKIVSLAVEKLQAGTVSVHVSLTSADLTCNLNGVTAQIANAWDSQYGQYAGLRVQQNSSLARALVSYAGMGVINSSGYRTAEISSGYFTLGDASGNVTIQATGTDGYMSVRQLGATVSLTTGGTLTCSGNAFIWGQMFYGGRLVWRDNYGYLHADNV